jgi:anti-sigma factor RsiW
MQCERAQELLSAYVDDELEGDEHRVIAAHVAECRSCAALADDFRRIGGLLAEAGREPVPKAFALRVRRNIAGVPEAQPQQVENVSSERVAGWLRVPGSLIRQAALLVVVSALSVLATWWLVSSNNQAAQLEQEVLSAHVRSLLQESPVQVASSNSHVVKPWFAGRVDFAPDVKDLTGDGFPLVGGRLDYVGRRRVGVLVYKRRLHTINVFMWPGRSSENTPPRLVTLNGYNILAWHEKGLTVWAISDLNAGELRELQSLL